MGENIADLGGLLLALDVIAPRCAASPLAFSTALPRDQRVFLGWAQGFGATSPGSMHSSGRSRPILIRPPVSSIDGGRCANNDAWYDAWGVEAGRQALSQAGKVSRSHLVSVRSFSAQWQEQICDGPRTPATSGKKLTRWQ